MSGDTQRLEEILSYRFSNSALLEQALTHRSAAKNHNERLEFLGDAVLDAVISELLYLRFSNASEGKLSRMRANLVNGDALADISSSLDLGQFLKLGSGEKKSGGKRRTSILADTLEALIAAIYLDGGFDAAKKVVATLFEERIAGENLDQPRKDSKTRLQEILQGKGMQLPEYELLEVSGEAHSQEFTVSCRIDLLGDQTIGKGKSKRSAEQNAAELALSELESLND